MRAQLLYAVYVPTFILAFCQGMLALLLPVYVIGLGLSYSLIGLVLAGYGIGTLIGDLPAGVIQDRIGNRLSMTIGICVMALGMLALSQSERFAMLVLCGISIGAGASLWNVSRHAYLAHNTLNSSRGRASQSSAASTASACSPARLPADISAPRRVCRPPSSSAALSPCWP